MKIDISVQDIQGRRDIEVTVTDGLCYRKAVSLTSMRAPVDYCSRGETIYQVCRLLNEIDVEMRRAEKVA